MVPELWARRGRTCRLGFLTLWSVDQSEAYIHLLNWEESTKQVKECFMTPSAAVDCTMLAGQLIYLQILVIAEPIRLLCDHTVKL